mmetsp:Transcript_2126/g.6325  ORF Transcript_2126/g.6325 Transcript_2126/m.6325 type:complete len:585 (-) Transcript_2126:679-2433(-)
MEAYAGASEAEVRAASCVPCNAAGFGGTAVTGCASSCFAEGLSAMVEGSKPLVCLRRLCPHPRRRRLGAPLSAPLPPPPMLPPLPNASSGAPLPVETGDSRSILPSSLSALAGWSAAESGADDTGLTASSSSISSIGTAVCSAAGAGACVAIGARRKPAGRRPAADPSAATAAAPGSTARAAREGASAGAARSSCSTLISWAGAGGSCCGLPPADASASGVTSGTAVRGVVGRPSAFGASPGSIELAGLSVTAAVAASLAERLRDDLRSVLPLCGERRLLLLWRRDDFWEALWRLLLPPLRRALVGCAASGEAPPTVAATPGVPLPLLGSRIRCRLLLLPPPSRSRSRSRRTDFSLDLPLSLPLSLSLDRLDDLCRCLSRSLPLSLSRELCRLSLRELGGPGKGGGPGGGGSDASADTPPSTPRSERGSALPRRFSSPLLRRLRSGPPRGPSSRLPLLRCSPLQSKLLECLKCCCLCCGPPYASLPPYGSCAVAARPPPPPYWDAGPATPDGGGGSGRSGDCVLPRLLLPMGPPGQGPLRPPPPPPRPPKPGPLPPNAGPRPGPGPRPNMLPPLSPPQLPPMSG